MTRRPRELVAQALRDAAAALGHARSCTTEPDHVEHVGCPCRISLLYYRADEIAAGRIALPDVGDPMDHVCDHTTCPGYSVDDMFNDRVRCACTCHRRAR